MTQIKDRDLYEATIKEPWCVHPNGSSIWTGEEYDTSGYQRSDLLVQGESNQDIEWIAHAHKRWPELLDEIERLNMVIKDQCFENKQLEQELLRELNKAANAKPRWGTIK